MTKALYVYNTQCVCYSEYDANFFHCKSCTEIFTRQVCHVVCKAQIMLTYFVLILSPFFFNPFLELP